MLIFQIDAFTDASFTGNPAAVCLLDRDVDEAWMRGEDEARPGSPQRLGDVPGEAAIIADAGDQREFAFEIDGYHEGLDG